METFVENRLEFQRVIACGIRNTHHLAEYEEHEEVILITARTSDDSPVRSHVVLSHQGADVSKSISE